MDLLLSWIARRVLNIDPNEITKELARDAAQRRMEDARPTIVARMVADGMTPQQAPPRAVIRDALFRLWRSVVPSGTVADFIRDSQDDKVLALVQPGVNAQTPLSDVVQRTMTAALDIAF